MYKSHSYDTYYPCKYLSRVKAVAEGRLVGMDNTKKHNTDMNANTKKSDRTAFADEINMDATNNKNKQNNK